MISSSFPTLLRYILPIWDEWHQMQILSETPEMFTVSHGIQGPFHVSRR